MADTHTFTYHPSNTIINSCDALANWSGAGTSKPLLDNNTFRLGTGSIKMVCSYKDEQIDYDNAAGLNDWKSGASPETGGFGFWTRCDIKGMLMGIKFKRGVVWDGTPVFYLTVSEANKWTYKHYELYDAPTHDWSNITGIRFETVRVNMSTDYTITSEENLQVFAGAVVGNYYIHDVADVGVFKRNHVYECTLLGGPPSTYNETVPAKHQIADVLDDDYYRILMKNLPHLNYVWEVHEMFNVWVDDIQVYTSTSECHIPDVDVTFVESVAGTFLGADNKFLNYTLYSDGFVSIVENGDIVPDPNTTITLTYSKHERADLFEKLINEVTEPLNTSDVPLREFLRAFSSQLTQHQVIEMMDFQVQNFIHLATDTNLDSIGEMLNIPRFNYTDYVVLKEYYHDKTGDSNRHLYIISTDAADVGLEFNVDGYPTDTATIGVAGVHTYSHTQWQSAAVPGVPEGINIMRLDEVPTGYVIVFDAHPGEGGGLLGEYCHAAGAEDPNYRIVGIFPPRETDNQYKKRLMASVKYLRTNGDVFAIRDLVSSLAVNLSSSDVLLDFGTNYGCYWGDGVNNFKFGDDDYNFYFDDYGTDGFKFIGFINDDTSDQVGYWADSFAGTQPAYVYVCIPDNSRYFNGLRAVFATHLLAKTFSYVFTGGIRIGCFTYTQIKDIPGD